MKEASANSRQARGSRPVVRTLGWVAIAIAATGCGATTQREAPKLASGTCGLIRPDICTMLVTGPSGGAGLRYLASGVQWSQYDKFMISPVAVYGGDTSKIPASDQQMLANYLYNALIKAFQGKLTVVDVPGPGVMKIQMAITDAEASTPGLRSVSMAVPQARVLATLKYAATGTYPFVGGVQGEVLATDSVSGQVLGAAVDRRVGGGSMKNAAQWEWGDAENAMDAWAELAVTRIQALRSGQAK